MGLNNDAQSSLCPYNMFVSKSFLHWSTLSETVTGVVPFQKLHMCTLFSPKGCMCVP